MQAPRRKFNLMFLGFGFVLALLLSLPLIAMATGMLDDGPKFTSLDNVPERGDGAYLHVNDGTRHGIVKLYAWNFRLNEFPADAPVFNPDDVTALIINQRGIDDPVRYSLFNLADGSAVPFDTKVGATKITFTPREHLRDGNYMIDIPKSGLSSDRQFLYFRIDSGARELPVK